jgi:hypothetical protein
MTATLRRIRKWDEFVGAPSRILNRTNGSRTTKFTTKNTKIREERFLFVLFVPFVPFVVDLAHPFAAFVGPAEGTGFSR